MPHFALALAGLAAATDATTNADVVWQWNRNTLACVLVQETSPAGEKVELRRTPGAAATGVLIMMPAHSKLSDVPNARGAISLDPGGVTMAEVDQRSDPDKGYLYVSTGIEDRTFMEKLSHATALEISGEGIQSARVNLKSAGAAVEALKQCEKGKMQEWGLDSVYLDALKTRPKPIKPLIERISAIDYPHMALAYSVQSDIFIRMDVAADGRVTSCKALNGAQYKGFEYAACDAIRGARFQPATDLQGRPVSAPYIFEIQFQMR
jgi:TonB family protein